MIIFNTNKKEPNQKHSSLSGVLRSKHFVVCAIIFVIITLSNMTAQSFAADNSISWTVDELVFMKLHPVIRLGVDPAFVPFEFIDDDGEYKGIAADYIDLISEKTGLKFEVLNVPTWPEAYSMALAGDVDALPAIDKTVERAKHFLFSKPYYFSKRVIVTRDADTRISGMDDLEGIAVAVQRYSSHHSYLSVSYTHLRRRRCKVRVK